MFSFVKCSSQLSCETGGGVVFPETGKALTLKYPIADWNVSAESLSHANCVGNLSNDLKSNFILALIPGFDFELTHANDLTMARYRHWIISEEVYFLK